MTNTDMDMIQGAEERLVNVWPAPSTMLMDGWVVRFAHGYSGRANSASAVITNASMPEMLITQIEHFYRTAGLHPCVRITPLAHPKTEEMLLKRGYVIKDEAGMMVVERERFAQHRVDPLVTINPRPDPDWLDGISIRQEASKRSPDHLKAIVGALRVPAAFATLSLAESLGSEKLGFGMSAVDRGWAELGSIMLDEKQRGQGHGRRIVTSLLAWANEKGAERAFLQVDVTNAVAIRLYESLGFKEIYRYRTLRLV